MRLPDEHMYKRAAEGESGFVPSGVPERALMRLLSQFQILRDR